MKYTLSFFKASIWKIARAYVQCFLSGLKKRQSTDQGPLEWLNLFTVSSYKKLLWKSGVCFLTISKKPGLKIYIDGTQGGRIGQKYLAGSNQ